MSEKIDIIGTKVTVTDPEEQLERVREFIHSEMPHYVTYTNVHVVVEARKNTRLREALANADIVSPDGMPLVFVGRFRGEKQMRRCSGPDMFELLLELSMKEGYTNYFYGSTPETLDMLQQAILAKFPGIRISGMKSPPFRKLSEEEDAAYIDEIKRLSPDLIWIGLGAPKQEIWMLEHKDKISAGVMLGVGAGFDFLAGTTRRAPGVMQKAGLEWLFRLMSEPRRLWKRYLVTNTTFVFYLLKDRLYSVFRISSLRKEAPDEKED